MSYRAGVGGEREKELAQTATEVASAATVAAAPVCATLERYRIEREIGAGGMGVVHAALDLALERRIALKVLRGAIILSCEQIEPDKAVVVLAVPPQPRFD
jgi:hypothetical protein